MKMRRRSSLVASMTAALCTLAVAAIAQIGPPTAPCGIYGEPVQGIASRSQTINHYRIFLNRFSATCRRDRQGIVSLRVDSSEAVVRAMLYRETDVLQRAYRFYGLERPLTSAEKQQVEQDTATFLFRVSPVVQVPLWVNGVGVAYNIGCVDHPIKLSSAALSKIFSGVVTRWNHDLLTSDNPELGECDQEIRLAVRSDASQATATFKEYLSKRDASWKPYLQPQTNTRWPATAVASCRGRGDPGMAACVAGEPGSIGYVTFAESFRTGLAMAEVENKTGFVAPGYAACTEAASSPAAGYPPAADLDWSHVSLTDGVTGYPICHLEFAMAFEKMLSAYQARVNVYEVQSVKDYLRTALLPATQERLPLHGVAPLPESLRRLSEAGVESITYFE